MNEFWYKIRQAIINIDQPIIAFKYPYYESVNMEHLYDVKYVNGWLEDNIGKGNFIRVGTMLVYNDATFRFKTPEDLIAFKLAF